MPTYNELVGRRLRSIRKQRGMSLQDVQRVSDQEFKAAVLGAYEVDGLSVWGATARILSQLGAVLDDRPAAL